MTSRNPVSARPPAFCFCYPVQVEYKENIFYPIHYSAFGVLRVTETYIPVAIVLGKGNVVRAPCDCQSPIAPSGSIKSIEQPSLNTVAFF